MNFVKPERKVDRVFIHCSASDHDDHDNVSTMRKWHLERGFDDVGYHFFIRRGGTVQPGRDLEKMPAAQKGHNKGTIALCVHGLTFFTPAQMRSVRDFCQQINTAYEGKVTFHGHREVSNKSCPVFDYRGVLGLSDSGQMPFDMRAN